MKKIIALALALILALSAVTVINAETIKDLAGATGSAEARGDTGTTPITSDIVDHSVTGTNLKWSLTTAGVLTISGTGAFPDFYDLSYDYRNDSWRPYTQSINTVIIGNGVTYIGDGMFAHMYGEYPNLTTVTFEPTSSVTAFGRFAFTSTSTITSFVIPASVTSMGEGALLGVTNISVEAGSQSYSVANGYLLSADGTTLYRSLADRTGALVIPNGVVTIADSAFDQGTEYNVTSITIPDSVEYIGDEAFPDFYYLTSVSIGAGVEYIGYGNFICSDMYNNMHFLTSFTVSANNPNLCAENGVLFDKDKTHLYKAYVEVSGDYVVPATVTQIDDYALAGCYDITSLDLPEDLGAFYGEDIAGYDGFNRLRNIYVRGEETYVYSLPRNAIQLEPISVVGYSGSSAEEQATKPDWWSDEYDGTWQYRFIPFGSTESVTYDANGGTFASQPAATTKTLKQPLTVTSTVPTRPGYTFIGYSLYPDNTLARYGRQCYYEAGTHDRYAFFTQTYATDPLTLLYAPGSHFNIEVPANTVLYANWVKTTMDLSASDTPYNADNSQVSGYISSIIGDNNGTSNTWIKQSADWIDVGETAELRIDYALRNTNAQAFSNMDVVFVYQTSCLTDDNPDIPDTLAGLTASILRTGLNNRVAFVPGCWDYMEDLTMDFSSDVTECMTFINGMRYTPFMTFTNTYSRCYDMLDSRTGADRNRDSIVIFIGAKEVYTTEEKYVETTDEDGIYGGEEIAAIKDDFHSSMAVVNIANWNNIIYSSDKAERIQDIEKQYNGMATSPELVFGLDDHASAVGAIPTAFTKAAGLDRPFVITIDDNYFRISDDTDIGGNYGSSIVSVDGNVVTWDVSALNQRENFYITIPLVFIENEMQAMHAARGTGDEEEAYPTSSSAIVLDGGESGTQLNTVGSPMLPKNAPSTRFYIRYVNKNDDIGEEDWFATTPEKMGGGTYTIPASLYDVEEYPNCVDEIGAPVNQLGGYNNSYSIFAGWFKTEQAALDLDLTQAYGRTVDLNVTNDALDGAEDDTITLYAGWVDPSYVTPDDADPNKESYDEYYDPYNWEYVSNSVNGFSLEGVQIKSNEEVEEGRDAQQWQNAQYNGMRFVTVYSNEMLETLGDLYSNGTTGYTAAVDSDVTYGYTMYAFTTDRYISELTNRTSGSTDVDCTATGNWNHKMFDDYRLSSVVIKYPNDLEEGPMDIPVEARAYVNYVDANGIARRAYSTYKSNCAEFAGGCRTSFRDVYGFFKPANAH